jgi:CHAT domain-containing protein
MEALYDARLHGGEDAAAAVRDASRRVLAARRAAHRSTHPFYWAAFSASGR